MAGIGEVCSQPHRQRRFSDLNNSISTVVTQVMSVNILTGAYRQSADCFIPALVPGRMYFVLSICMVQVVLKIIKLPSSKHYFNAQIFDQVFGTRFQATD
jgi:hypothetical protein